MASSPRGRHAQPRARLLSVRLSPTTLAIGGLVTVFALAGFLALHVMTVPEHLRQDGAPGPPVAATRHSAAASPTRPTEARAARSDERHTPTSSPSASPTQRRVASTTAPAPAPKTSSPRPSPRPSPSSSSSGPLPLPTFTRPAHH